MCIWNDQDELSALSALPAPLLRWFRAEARDLPWRRTQEPYPIWVSEIMLQQTRVAAVLDYYARFLAAFPQVEDLAAAPEEQLMKLWEGLGYYSRARNLQKAARMIAERGSFPDTYLELLKLPGVGDYTASAIAAAAFGEPQAAVDGNVLRVVSRLTDCHADVADPKTKTAVRAAVQAVMPQTATEVRIFNQAMMELGATVCIPRGAPKCEQCPAGDFCLARKRGTIEELPVKAAKKPRRQEEKTLFVLRAKDKVALRQRPKTGLLAGLWEFPNVPGHLPEAEAAQWVAEQGLRLRQWNKALTAKHIFTHVEWDMVGYSMEVEEAGGDFHWVDLAGLNACALPSAFARCTEEAKESLREQEELT